jgi:hypothetical protein
MREHFDSRAAAAACTDLDFSRRKSRPPLPSPEELQAQRQEAVRDGAVYVNGACGVTVFNWGNDGPDGYQHLKDTMEEMAETWQATQPVKPRRRKLIPGVGFATDQN